MTLQPILKSPEEEIPFAFSEASNCFNLDNLSDDYYTDRHDQYVQKKKPSSESTKISDDSRFRHLVKTGFVRMGIMT